METEIKGKEGARETPDSPPVDGSANGIPQGDVPISTPKGQASSARTSSIANDGGNYQRILDVQAEFWRQQAAGEIPNPNPDYIALIDALVAIENGCPCPLTVAKVVILQRMVDKAEKIFDCRFADEERGAFLFHITTGWRLFGDAETIDFFEPITDGEYRSAAGVLDLGLLEYALENEPPSQDEMALFRVVLDIRAGVGPRMTVGRFVAWDRALEAGWCPQTGGPIPFISGPITWEERCRAERALEARFNDAARLHAAGSA